MPRTEPSVDDELVVLSEQLAQRRAPDGLVPREITRPFGERIVAYHRASRQLAAPTRDLLRKL